MGSGIDDTPLGFNDFPVRNGKLLCVGLAEAGGMGDDDSLYPLKASVALTAVAPVVEATIKVLIPRASARCLARASVFAVFSSPPGFSK
jgi:hypothetical protein